MSLDEENLTHKIANLLRIAERRDDAEAESARCKAEELMSKHRLHVILDRSEDVDYEERRLRVTPEDRQWVCALVQTLRQQHACNAYFFPTPLGFGYLIITGSTERIDAMKKALDRYTTQICGLAGKHDSPSFRLGAAAAVYEMFQEQHRRANEAREAREGPETALVLSRRYVTAPTIAGPGITAHPQPSAADLGDDGLRAEGAHDAYMEMPEEEWVEPKVSSFEHRMGYTVMRKALGMRSGLDRLRSIFSGGRSG